MTSEDYRLENIELKKRILETFRQLTTYEGQENFRRNVLDPEQFIEEFSRQLDTFANIAFNSGYFAKYEEDRAKIEQFGSL